MNGFIVIVVPFKKGFGANGPTITLYYLPTVYHVIITTYKNAFKNGGGED